MFLHVHSTEYGRSGEAVNPYIAGIERQACACATHVFAVSRYTANVLVSRYGVPRNKITMVCIAPDESMNAFADEPADAKRVARWMPRCWKIGADCL